MSEQQAHEQQRTSANRFQRQQHQDYVLGDLVWVYRPNLANELNFRKMTNPWDGPGQVLRIISATRIEVLLPTRREPRRSFIVHPDRLRRYQVPFHQSWQVEGRPYKFPLTLLSRRVHAGEVQYRVRWLSVEPISDSWVSSDKLPVHLTASYDARTRRVNVDHLLPSS